MIADKLLTDAAQIMQERAKQYDSPTGERSMGRAVAAFNCVTGNKMTEAEGWLLLQLLKDVRQWTTPDAAHVDSLQDCIAYAALKAECIIVSKGEIDWGDDKELPSSGIYGNEKITALTGKEKTGDVMNMPSGMYCINLDQGYTEQDLRSVADLTAHTADTRNSPVGGALVRDAESVGDWIEHVSEGCPLSDESIVVEVRNRIDKTIDSGRAEEFEWGYGWRKSHGDLIISHWRYGKDQ